MSTHTTHKKAESHEVREVQHAANPHATEHVEQPKARKHESVLEQVSRILELPADLTEKELPAHAEKIMSEVRSARGTTTVGFYGAPAQSIIAPAAFDPKAAKDGNDGSKTERKAKA